MRHGNVRRWHPPPARPRILAVPDGPASPPPLSGLSVAAFLVGVTPAGPLALPLGGLAWRRIRTRGQCGRPIALAAIALGLVWIAGFGLAASFWVRSGVGPNERAALHELALLREGQRQFAAQRLVDQDRDGVGEYACFPELGGGPLVRTDGGHRTIPPEARGPDLVSRLFASAIERDGIVRKWGYCFRCWLPAPGGALGGLDGVPAGDAAAADRQEAEYLIYAWPEVHGGTGVRAFVLHGATGRTWACSNGVAQYAAAARSPAPAAAFPPDGGPPEAFPAAGAEPGPGTGGRPRDGEDWTPLGE